MTTPDTGLGPVDLLKGWTPGVHTMPQKYAGGASFVGVATKPWPEESGRLGKRLHRCEHRHRSREAAVRRAPSSHVCRGAHARWWCVVTAPRRVLGDVRAALYGSGREIEEDNPQAADALRGLLAGWYGWEAYTEYRVEHSSDGGTTWHHWYRVERGEHVTVVGAYLDDVNRGAGRTVGRLVEEDVVVLRSAPRVVQSETPPLVRHGPSISDAPEVVVRARALALNAEGAAQVEWAGAEDATRGRGAS